MRNCAEFRRKRLEASAAEKQMRPNASRRSSIHYRAQMEILGLAIIVVLVMLGVLFAIQFVLRQPPQNIAQDYKESQLASGLLTTMLGATTSCHEATVTELLQDCAAFRRVQCATGNSCEEAGLALKSMLDSTLGTWKRSYRFSITGTPSTETETLSFSSGSCAGEIQSSTNPVPTAEGTLQARLDLCE